MGNGVVSGLISFTKISFNFCSYDFFFFLSCGKMLGFWFMNSVRMRFVWQNGGFLDRLLIERIRKRKYMQNTPISAHHAAIAVNNVCVLLILVLCWRWTELPHCYFRYKPEKDACRGYVLQQARSRT